MKNIKYLLLLLALGSTQLAQADRPKVKPDGSPIRTDTPLRVTERADCAQSTVQTDMDINNVRARLLGGGDVWFDLRQTGKYVVPKVAPGLPEVSSVFAGSVWIGGKTPGNNLKIAAQTFRSATANDFWPGPLSPIDGTVTDKTCADWDRHFIVTARDIDKFKSAFNTAEATGQLPLDSDKIPASLRGWPGKGNPYFSDIYPFDLPSTGQGLAGFWDQDGNGAYDPSYGDYPIIEIRGCSEPIYPDQMVFWIYNDAGGVHTQSKGAAIKMEVQVQAFAYNTNDELNDMTFQRYKLINRATEVIDSCYFAMWMDPDLGCSFDDFVGCDTTRSLAYVYNQDELDGRVGCTCDAVPTYCSTVPILGLDYFRGPLDQDGKELGMSSFTYYNITGNGNEPGTTDPSQAIEFYYYITGRWKDGTPVTLGGDAYNPGGGVPTRYVFPDAPNETGSKWSMCNPFPEVALPSGDRRTLQASGPLKLLPSAVNELIIGVVWVPDQQYPCPSIKNLQAADDLAQNLFNACFKPQNGPDAPDVDIIELDRELVIVLTNKSDPSLTNNSFEQYKERDLQAPKGTIDSNYVFEGYKIFQLAGPEVVIAGKNDPEKSKLIYQVDVKNKVATLYNWSSVENPSVVGGRAWSPNVKVQGIDAGIRHTFSVKEDQFTRSQDKRLVNHRKYYYTVVAYGYNQYGKFDVVTELGQRNTYIEGRRYNEIYASIPRPVVDKVLNTSYGDGVIITRTDGEGSGGNFLDIDETTRAAIIAGTANNKVTYKPGAAPIAIKVFNPLDVTGGDFELTIEDNDLANDTLETGAFWKLKNLGDGTVITSDISIDKLNEQIIARYGFTVTIGQVPNVGTDPINVKDNGYRGSSLVYADPTKGAWLDVPIEGSNPLLNYIKTENIANIIYYPLDPNAALSNATPFVPFYLTSAASADGTGANPIYLTPSYYGQSSAFWLNNAKASMNNVDIIFTSDKSKWSRCVVIETASTLYYGTPVGGDIVQATQNGSFNWGLRKVRSVTKDADPNDPFKARLDDSTSINDTGMGWFPGYAINVETGRRLNIFFGENSTYDGRPIAGVDTKPLYPNGRPIGNDMIWNPNSQKELLPPGSNSLYSYISGGQHHIYVSTTDYDSCRVIRTNLARNQGAALRTATMGKISWTCFPILPEGSKLLSYADGLIPNDLTVKMRVDKSYSVTTPKGAKNGYPTYQFSTNGKLATPLDKVTTESALDLINVVPNPYYGFSDYETSQFTNIVKITNLPAKCTVTIYSLDGRFIKQYKRDEQPEGATKQNAPRLNKQITPAIEWDMKNSKSIPISSGVYIININAPGLGERTIKWFGVNRQFDPTGL